MRKYELMIIIHPRHDDRGAEEVSQAVISLLEGNTGTINKVNVWGRRKLAYPIKGQREGTYIVYKVELDPASIKQIEFALKLNDEILRFLLVKDELVEEEVESVALDTDDADDYDDDDGADDYDDYDYDDDATSSDDDEADTANDAPSNKIAA